jgi:small-conductance mechanosensitive channel
MNIISRIWELEKEGIEIPFPQRVVWFANELSAREMRGSESENPDYEG